MRWVTERKETSLDNEILTIIEIYAQDENKEIVKKENRHRKYKRYLVKG